MKLPNYICAKCRLPFTRRWNANRHCNNKHYGEVENIISYTEYITNQNDYSYTILSSSYEDNINPPSNLRNELFFDKLIIYPKNNNFPSNTLTDPLEEALDRELSPYKLLEQLGPKYEEMRHVLECVPEPTRTKWLGNALSAAINSNNPVQTMSNKLTDFRKAKSNEMMLNDLAAFYGIDKDSTKEFKINNKTKGIFQFNK
jgi:hypothetical protein